MAYFTQSDHNAVLADKMGTPDASQDMERLHRRMVSLQRSLHARMKTYGLPLHPNHAIPGGVTQHSVAAPLIVAQSMTFHYMRSQSEARVVEQIMGRDGLNSEGKVEAHRHPVIELRLTPDNFAVEMVIGPDAWYDQQNFVGKFTVSQHRSSLYKLLARLEPDYCLGFWSGIHLNDMHLTTGKLPPARVFFEFVDTFAAGRDIFRVGYWYNAGDERLVEESIEQELFGRLRDLYTIYEYMLWTSNNNFHNFYRKEHQRSR